MMDLLLRIGIDDFSDINERFGVEYGDRILKTVADDISSQLTGNQKAYRMTGDEFLIEDLVESNVFGIGPDENDADELFHRIRKAVDESICKSGYEAVYTISAGIISSENTSVRGYKELMKYSQFALSEAKKRRKKQSVSISNGRLREIFTQKGNSSFLTRGSFIGISGI